MLGKLLKHEFRATSGAMLIVWLGLVAVSGLSLLVGLIYDILDVDMLLPILSLPLFFLIAVAAVVTVYVLIIRRFYTNVYGDEGYLTLTLPVSRGTILMSKLICSTVWLISTYVLLLLTFMIFMIGVNGSFFEMLSVFDDAFSDIIAFFDIPAPLAVIELIIFAIITPIMSVLMLYASISIGQLFSKHRFVGALLGYLGVSFAKRLANGCFSAIMGVKELLNRWGYHIISSIYSPYMGVAPYKNVGYPSGFEVQMILLSYFVMLAVFTLLLGFFTSFMMKKAVNLQ